MKAFTPFIIVFLVVLADQVLKFWIKLNMYLGQEFLIFGNWFKLHFTENEGMAFGMELGGDYGKLMLTLFRLFAVGLITYYLSVLVKRKAPFGLIISISLILAGALGNIIDSVFYGVIFSDSIYGVARLFPEEGGYGTLLHGKVVDMFYFPLYEGFLPEWVPLWGGDYFIFFRPVFNIADAAITVGVFFILIFQKKYFNDDFFSSKSPKPASTEEEIQVESTSDRVEKT